MLNDQEAKKEMEYQVISQAVDEGADENTYEVKESTQEGDDEIRPAIERPEIVDERTSSAIRASKAKYRFDSTIGFKSQTRLSAMQVVEIEIMGMNANIKLHDPESSSENSQIYVSEDNT